MKNSQKLIYYSVFYVYHLILKKTFEKMDEPNPTQITNSFLFYVTTVTYIIIVITEILSMEKKLQHIADSLVVKQLQDIQYYFNLYLDNLDPYHTEVDNISSLLSNLNFLELFITNFMKLIVDHDTAQAKEKAIVNNNEALINFEAAKATQILYFIENFCDLVAHTKKALDIANANFDSVCEVISKIDKLRSASHRIKFEICLISIMNRAKCALQI